MNESHIAYEWVMPHIKFSHDMRMSQVWHGSFFQGIFFVLLVLTRLISQDENVKLMWHTRISRIANVNKSYYTYE